MSRRAVSVTLLVICAWLGAYAISVALGQGEPDKRGGQVEVTMGVVAASNSGKMFDHRLASLRSSFRLFPYSSFRLLKQERRRVNWRREAEFHLPGGHYLLVIPSGYRDGRVSLNVMLIRGRRSLVNTVLKLKDKGTFLVGGPRYQDGVLFVSIGAAIIR